MNPVLLPLYGPIAIHAYGLFIVIGALTALFLFSRDKKIKKYVTSDQIATIVQIIIAGAYFGGRIIFMFSESITDLTLLFRFWEPGFSILGSILGIGILLPIYLQSNKIPGLLFLDRVSLYAPLIQGFGRIGCFFTGCCYGKPTDAWYAVTYTHENHVAPLFYSLHPSQLYSSTLLFLIFFLLYFIQQYRVKTPGLLFMSYLILISAERFLIDFVRWDRILLDSTKLGQLFSFHQWIALSIGVYAAIASCILLKVKK